MPKVTPFAYPSSIHQADVVLRHLQGISWTNGYVFEEDVEIFFDTCIFKTRVGQIIEYLEDRGFIVRVEIASGGKAYKTTFVGDLFVEQGCFIGEKEASDLIKQKGLLKEQSVQSHARATRYIAVGALIAAGFQALFSCLDLFHREPENQKLAVTQLTGLFLFLSLCIAGLIVWLVVTEMRQSKK